jgi:uncharacterized protein (UPF0261 family)
VLLLATVETKREEIAFFNDALAERDVTARIIDISLSSHGEVWDAARKLAAMDEAATSAIAAIHDLLETGEIRALVGLGGGTGGEIILRVLRKMPFAFPKMLITTLPFDPRFALADNSIVLVPTLADICGLNASLRQVLNNASAMVAGLCQAPVNVGHVSDNPSIGITALGATSAAAGHLVQRVREQGHEATVFHANGFGGAAFARFVSHGALKAVIDMTCHELTRLLFTGAHMAMPSRFTAASSAGLPQVVLPGGLNFLGLGELALVPRRFLERPHYQHSGYFTHVKLTQEEMEGAARVLINYLNAAEKPVDLIIPMGGFSHQDAPGGEIEDVSLRELFAQIAREHAADTVQITELPFHINDPQTATVAAEALASALGEDTTKGT